MKITIRRNDGKTQTQRTAELAAVLQSLQTETKAQPVTNARQLLPYAKTGVSYDYMQKLPTLHFAAAFQRSKEDGQAMAAYNGLLLLEVNHLAGPFEVDKVKERVRELPQTLLAFAGSSNRSVKIVVRFTRPDDTLPRTREEAVLFHAHAYRRAVRYYEPQLAPYAIEMKEPTLEQGCRLSYDPNLYYAPDAPAIYLAQPLQMPGETTYQEAIEAEKDPLMRLMPGYDRQRIISTLFESALKNAYEATDQLGEAEYLKPMLIHLAKNCFDSGVPEEEAVKWTLVHLRMSAYESEIRLTFRNAYKKAQGFGQKARIGKTQRMVVGTEEYMKRRYEIRYNKMTTETEYRERNTYRFYFKPVDERALNSMVLNAMKEDLEVWNRDVLRYVHSDRVPVFSPVDDWFAGLPVWDGKDRIRALAATVPCKHRHWENLFYRWFLSMVCHWQGRDTKHANSTSPLLVGPQGYRKSTFCLSLIPPDLRAYFTDSIDFSSKKDAMMFLNRFLLINIDEFDQVTEAQQGFLKHILQKPVVNARLSHRSVVRQLQRYASFIGTSNQKDLLSDPSGSRRFICVEVTAPIDLSRPINYEQLYAQALAALRAGERSWFDAKEEAIMTAHNEDFQQTPVTEQLFHQYFRLARAGQECEKLLAVEILERLQKRSKIKVTTGTVAHFGRFLQKLGARSLRTSHGVYYEVVDLDKWRISAK